MVIPNQSTAIPTRSGQVLRRYKDEEADRDRRARVEWGKIGEFAHRGIADGAFDWIEYALQSSRRGIRFTGLPLKCYCYFGSVVRRDSEVYSTGGFKNETRVSNQCCRLELIPGRNASSSVWQRFFL